MLGISLSNPDGSPTRAGQAYLNTRDWLLAAPGRAARPRARSPPARWQDQDPLREQEEDREASLRCHAGCKLTGVLCSGSKIKVGSAPIRLS